MNTASTGALLLRRKYTNADQAAFASLSGDHNPLHMDAASAQRATMGGVVVHGIHLAVSALEALLAHLKKKGNGPGAIIRVVAQFSKPVFVDEKVRFQLAKQTSDWFRISGFVEDTPVFRVSIQFGNRLPTPDGFTMSSDVSEPLVDARFEELTKAQGHLPIAMDAAPASRLFPHVMSNLGALGMAEILALTRLVGMRCPGLHSLFGQFDVRFDGDGAQKMLRYEVAESDERYRSFTLKVEGPRLAGTVQAFVWPPPDVQPETAVVARSVPPGSFAGSIAFIVGGSRGVGEITAKIIAAGGGLTVITYSRGAADAERVAGDIQAWGGRCEIMQFDVRRINASVRKLFSRKQHPRTLYYFATPRIRGRRRRFFNDQLLDEFNEIYVKAFSRLLGVACAGASQKLRVLYPSSIAVEEITPELAEYSMSKRMGEDLCSFYNRNSTNVEISVERLPRIKTDQNSTLIPASAADALDVMLPIIQRVEAFVLNRMHGNRDAALFQRT